MEATLPAAAGASLGAAHRSGLATFVSPITAWEIGTLARKGRLRSKLAPLSWFAELMRAPGLALAAMPPEILIESSLLPGFANNDPADRVVAATARAFGYTVVTRDAALLDYGGRGYLDVLPC